MLDELRKIKIGTSIDTANKKVSLKEDDFLWVVKNLEAMHGGQKELIEDVIIGFLLNCCVLSDGDTTRDFMLYQSYKNWAIRERCILLDFAKFNECVSGHLESHKSLGTKWHVGLIRDA